MNIAISLAHNEFVCTVCMCKKTSKKEINVCVIYILNLLCIFNFYMACKFTVLVAVNIVDIYENNGLYFSLSAALM